MIVVTDDTILTVADSFHKGMSHFKTYYFINYLQPSRSSQISVRVPDYCVKFGNYLSFLYERQTVYTYCLLSFLRSTTPTNHAIGASQFLFVWSQNIHAELALWEETRDQSNSKRFIQAIYLLTYLLTYLLHGAESFLSSWLACS